jgi:hypothetical protein
MDSDGIMAGLFFYFLLGSIISAVVGYAIDEGRGLIWGLVLGPIGWIIAAILKGKDGQVGTPYRSPEPLSQFQRQPVRTVAPSRDPVETEELRKWNILKEVDPDIRASSQRVVEVNPELDQVLAQKYLALNDKQYLQSLTNLVIDAHKLQMEAEEAATANVASADLERSKRSKKLYEMSLGPDRISPETGGRVSSVEIYHGSWVPFKGGIRVVHDDGRNLLLNNSMRRTFPAGDNGWE